MIEGVRFHPLCRIPDERGSIMHMLRCDDPHFQQFGEIYFSTAYPGAIKGWHAHKVMTLNYAVVVGTIKLVLFDDRVDSISRGSIQIVFVGWENYALVTVSPGIWSSWQCLGNKRAIVANCATHPYDPEEVLSLDPFSSTIPYEWGGGNSSE